LADKYAADNPAAFLFCVRFFGRRTHFLLIAAVVLLGASYLSLAVTAPGCELGSREGDAAEQLAGILGAAGGVTAFLGGNAVVHNRHDQLGVPFQPDDGELPQGDIEPSAVILEHQVLIEHGLDPVRQLHGAVPAAALAGLPDSGAQDHGVQGLHHGRGPVCQIPGNGLRRAGPQVAAVDVGAALLAAEDNPFGEDCQTAQRGRAVGPHNGVGQDPVVEGDVDAVVVSVKGHGLHVYVGAEKLRAADPGTGGAFQHPLGTGGQIDRQVLYAVFVPTGVGDLSGVDGHGLPQIVGIAAQGVRTLICHGITS